jgi:hypothetical protein
MSAFHTKKPTIKWICGPLKNKYTRKISKCKNDVGKFLGDLGLENTSGPRDVDLEETENQINQWFEFYCGEATDPTDPEVSSEESEEDERVEIEESGE